MTRKSEVFKVLEIKLKYFFSSQAADFYFSTLNVIVLF